MKKLLLLIPILILVAYSCKKTSITKEQNAPVITIAHPTEGASYHVGDTIFIQGSFADDSQIQAFTIDVKRTGANIFSTSGISDTTYVPIDTFVVVPTAMSGAYQLILYCEDPNNNFTNKVVNFTAAP